MIRALACTIRGLFAWLVIVPQLVDVKLVEGPPKMTRLVWFLHVCLEDQLHPLGKPEFPPQAHVLIEAVRTAQLVHHGPRAVSVGICSRVHEGVLIQKHRSGRRPKIGIGGVAAIRIGPEKFGLMLT